jgi:hypothetical protein
VGLVSIRWIRRRLPYEHWHLLHLLAYLAAALSFTHQLAGPNLTGNRAVQIAWSLLYAYAFALVIRHRVLQPLHQLWRHRLRVEEIVPESGDVVSIVMSGAHLDELRAEAGQFFRWRFLTPVDLARFLPVLAVRTTHQPPAADHHQSSRRGHRAVARPASRHQGARRGPVRPADRAPAPPPAGAADRRRGGHHPDAGALRDP